MEKMEKFIIRNWIWLVAGLVLTRKAVELAYAWRGYAGFGGEWFVLPVLLMTVGMVRYTGNFISELLGFPKEVGADDRRTSKDHSRMGK